MWVKGPFLCLFEVSVTANGEKVSALYIFFSYAVSVAFPLPLNTSFVVPSLVTYMSRGHYPVRRYGAGGSLASSSLPIGHGTCVLSVSSSIGWVSFSSPYLL